MKITDKLVLFFGNNDICSNFYLCPLQYEGHKFHSTEQLFMYLKAKTFKDSDAEKEILKCKTPREAKALGRKVKNYDDKIWNTERDHCMYIAILAKFMQCKEFRRFICNHKDKIFAEASPYDSIWGIKLSEEDPRALDPSKWRGENRLGKCINKLISTYNDLLCELSERYPNSNFKEFK